MLVHAEPNFQMLHYHSRALDREMHAACFMPAPRPALPEENRQFPMRYPLLVLLHGYGGNFLDWHEHTKIARYLADYGVIVAFPDGGNGWYTNAANGQERREDDIIEEFLPFLQQKLPLLPPGPSWGIGGLSMGGYGAIKLALKYPQLFCAAFSHSSALKRPLTPSLDPVFGDPTTDAKLRMQENVFWLAEQALCRIPIERPHLFLDCGVSDPLLDINRQFSEHLRYLGYGHEFREMPGHHSWPYWNRAFRTILPTIVQKLGVSTITTN